LRDRFFHPFQDARIHGGFVATPSMGARIRPDYCAVQTMAFAIRDQKDGFEQSFIYQVASGAKIHFTIHRNERGSRWGDFTAIHGRQRPSSGCPDNATYCLANKNPVTQCIELKHVEDKLFGMLVVLAKTRSIGRVHIAIAIAVELMLYVSLLSTRRVIIIMTQKATVNYCR